MNKIIIGFDPGGTTGVAVMRLTDTDFKLEKVDQWKDPDNVWKKMLHLIKEYESEDLTILCESFEHRPDVIEPDETPKYIIKDLDRFVVPYYEEEFHYRLASQAKVGIPPAKNGRPDRLKAFGLYQRGYRHANDAIRHILSYALDKLRHRPLIEAGWGTK